MNPIPKGLFPKVTIPSFVERASQGEKLVCLTAYDYTMARLVDEAGADLILVGDSLAAIVQGHGTTLPVTMDEMVYHCRCVTKGATRALVVGDLPFMSYQVSKEDALRNAGRLVKEGGVAAVKLEGGTAVADTISSIVRSEIPVVGHVGLTPQAFHRMGGHKVQGKGKKGAGSREQVVEDALAVEEGGAFAIVLEGVPAELAAEISEKLSIPTIGIGAGAACNAQILVTHDLLGFSGMQPPRFVKQYTSLHEIMTEAIKEYSKEVREGLFPSVKHTYGAN